MCACEGQGTRWLAAVQIAKSVTTKQNRKEKKKGWKSTFGGEGVCNKADVVGSTAQPYTQPHRPFAKHTHTRARARGE